MGRPTATFGDSMTMLWMEALTGKPWLYPLSAVVHMWVLWCGHDYHVYHKQGLVTCEREDVHTNTRDAQCFARIYDSSIGESTSSFPDLQMPLMVDRSYEPRLEYSRPWKLMVSLFGLKSRATFAFAYEATHEIYHALLTCGVWIQKIRG